MPLRQGRLLPRGGISHFEKTFANAEKALANLKKLVYNLFIIHYVERKKDKVNNKLFVRNKCKLEKVEHPSLQYRKKGKGD